MGKFSDIWNRSKDGANREQRGFVRYAIVATMVLVVFLFVKKGNLVRWAQAGLTLKKQARQTELYQKEIERLEREVELLSTDRDTLENFAREKFQFAEPGDDVYIEAR